MRIACLTPLAFLSFALLASMLEAQQPVHESSSSRRAVQQTSFSVLTRGLPQADAESDEPIKRPPLEVDEEIVRVAQNPSAPGMSPASSRQMRSPGIQETVILNSPMETYPPQSIVEYYQSSFNPAVPLSELQGPTFGDTYFRSNPVDEWEGFCGIRNIQSDNCGCNTGKCGGGCRNKTHRERKCDRKACRCGGCQRDNVDDRCPTSNCSNTTGRTLQRDHKCRRANGNCGCNNCGCGCR